MVKNQSDNAGDKEMQVHSLGWEAPPEDSMAIHVSILVWRIPWPEEPGGLQSIWLQRAGHNWSDLLDKLWKAFKTEDLIAVPGHSGDYENAPHQRWTTDSVNFDWGSPLALWIPSLCFYWFHTSCRQLPANDWAWQGYESSPPPGNCGRLWGGTWAGGVPHGFLELLILVK